MTEPEIKMAKSEFAELQGRILEWQRDHSAAHFQVIYRLSEPLIHQMIDRYINGARTHWAEKIEEREIQAFVIAQVMTACEVWDPRRGAAYHSVLYRELQRIGRYVRRIVNEKRAMRGEPKLPDPPFTPAPEES